MKQNGAWSLIGRDGEPVGKQTFTDICMDENRLCSVGGVLFARDAGGWLLVDTEGKPCSELRFEAVRPFFDEGAKWAAASAGGLWGFVDKNGEWAAQPAYEQADSFGNGLAPVCQDGLWGYVDTALRMVIQPQFLEAGPFASCKLAPVRTETGWRYIKLLA